MLIRVHLTSGSVKSFVQPDVAAVQKIWESIELPKLFAIPRIVVGKAERSLLPFPWKEVGQSEKAKPLEIGEGCRCNWQGKKRISKIIIFVLLVIGGAFATSSVCAQAEQTPAVTNLQSEQIGAFVPHSISIWQGGIGDGFQPATRTIGFVIGATPGLKDCGSTQSHGLALAGLSFGRMIGKVKGEGHWYRGNWEIRVELLGGAQYSPTTEWLVGLTPHLRYNFDTGNRWIPFIDAGVGPSVTGIRRPDLSGTFEFNDQGNVGLCWFMRDDVALTVEAGYMHLSNAGIDHPNNGVNCVKGMAGVSWFF